MSPREALRDPDLPFNLTVMRAHDARRRQLLEQRLGMLTEKLKHDPFARIVMLVDLLLEEV